MARISDSDSDPERGVFLLPNGHANTQLSPSSSHSSGRSAEGEEGEGLSTSRETESSAATPTRPLLIARPLNNNQNGGTGNARHDSSVYDKHYKNGSHNKNTKTGWKAKHKTNKKGNKLISFCKGKEHWCCIFGSVTFVLGIVLLTVAAVVFMQVQSLSSKTPPSGASAVSDNQSHTPSSPHVTSSHVTSSTTSATTRPTTTFNYDALVNIAAGLRAYQSSTKTDDVMTYSAELAVDASDNHTLESGSCALTETGLKPFWWIDLSSYKLVKRVRIFTPTDCCHSSLVDVEVRIGQSEELSSNPLCQRISNHPIDGVVEVVCDRKFYGRYLSIQMMGSDNTFRELALCEVEIYES